MISGTIHNESQTQASEVESNQELTFLAEKADKERARYHELKQRYDDPESKVFKNEWFLKNHLNPAWNANTEAHEKLLATKTTLITILSVEHDACYRFFASCVRKEPTRVYPYGQSTGI